METCQSKIIIESEDLFLSLLSNIQNYIPSWKSLTLSDISFSRLLGLTNITYKVQILKEATEIIPKVIVYREFCQNQSFFSPKEESYIFSNMSTMGIGPQTYGGTNVFRLEEFIFGKHPDMALMLSESFALAMSKFMAEFHLVELRELDDKPSCLKYLDKGHFYQNFLIKTEEFQVKVEERELKLIQKLREFVSDEEFDFLKKKLIEINGKVCFCHNDLNANNIFLRDTGLDLKNSVSFIDYEYCSYNYRGYDIGNFFIERTFDYNYTSSPYYIHNYKNFPSIDLIRKFSIFYLFFEFINPLKLSLDIKVLSYNVVELVEFLGKNGIFITLESFSKNVEKLIQEIELGTLLSLMYWILWCGTICKNPNINFDYLLHGVDRIETYLKLKDIFFKS